MSSLQNWAGELRRIKFMTRNDFTLANQWTPTFTADSGTFVPAVTVTEYWIRDGLVHIIFYVSGTTNMTPTEIYFTLPVPPRDVMIDVATLACSVADSGGSPISGTAIITSKNRVKCTTYDRTAFTAGSGVKLFVSGFYKP